jgi:diacylglycerol kinase
MKPEASGRRSQTESSDFANKSPLESTRRAMAGWREYTRRSRRNWLYQIFLSIAVIATALGVNFDAVRLALVIMNIALVFAVEMLNTAIEVLLNWLQPEYHAVAKTVKDLAAGAVLTVSLGSVVAGIFLFWTPLAGSAYEGLILKVVGTGLMALLGVTALVSRRGKG